MKKYRSFLLILVILSSFGLSCRNKQEKTQPIAVSEEARLDISNSELRFTAQENNRINNLRDAGGLKAAVLLSRDNYLPQDDGSVLGFDYQLAEYLCRQLDLPLVIDPQEDFSLFFSNEGRFDNSVIKNEEIVYTPDLLKTNDIYILPLTINVWRERLTTMIPMFPTGVGLYGRGAENITSFKQMDNMTAAVLKESSHEHLIQEIENDYDVSLERFYVPAEEDAGSYLVNGEADISVEGIVASIKNIAAYPELSISPLLLKKITIGWALKKDDELLSSIITKLIEKSLIDGVLQKIFLENYDVDFDVMLNLLGE